MGPRFPLTNSYILSLASQTRLTKASALNSGILDRQGDAEVVQAEGPHGEAGILRLFNCQLPLRNYADSNTVSPRSRYSSTLAHLLIPYFCYPPESVFSESSRGYRNWPILFKPGALVNLARSITFMLLPLDKSKTHGLIPVGNGDIAVILGNWIRIDHR